MILKKLEVGYSQSMLHEIDLEIVNPSIILLVGRNGVGKSTLLKTIVYLLKPLQGEIFYQGKSFAQSTFLERAQWVSFAGTKRDYFGELRVQDFILMSQSLFEKNNKDADFMDLIIGKLQLEKYLNLTLNRLSDGEYQLVNIARAICQNTPFVLLDEPTAFLDYENKKLFFEMINELKIGYQKSFIISTHDIADALSVANRVWWLKENKLFDYDCVDVFKKEFVV